MNLDKIHLKIKYLLKHKPLDAAGLNRWNNEMGLLRDMEQSLLESGMTEFTSHTIVCTICNECKHEAEFSLNSNPNHGRKHQCKKCVNLRHMNRIKERREQDPILFKADSHAQYERYKERILSYQRNYKKLHPPVSKRKKPIQTEEEKKAKQKAYHQSHPRVLTEKDLENRKAYREAHKEELNAKNKAYREVHKEELNAKGTAYREAKKAEMKLCKEKAREMFHQKEMVRLQRLSAKKNDRVINITHQELEDLDFMKSKLAESYESICYDEPLDKIFLIKTKPYTFYVPVIQVIKRLSENKE